MSLPKLNTTLEYTEIVLPKINKVIRVRPFKFKDEKTLLIKIGDRKNSKVVFESILNFLKSCVHDEDLKVYSEINKTDFLYLMMKMRQITKGDKIELKNTCTNCKLKYDTFISIEENLKVELPKTNQIVLLDGQLIIKLKDAPITEEMKMTENKQNSKNDENDDRKLEYVYNYLYSSIEEIVYENEIYNSFSKEEISAFMDDLPGSENAKLLNELSKMISSIKIHKEINCPSCKEKNIIDQDSLNFFFY